MSFHTKRQALLIPAAKVADFNKFMERNGYGPNLLVPTDANAVGAAADAKAKAPTHYSLEIASADDGIIAAARKALAKCNDKLPEKEKGVEKVAFKAPEHIIGDKKPTPRPILSVDKLIEDAGLKKKAEKEDTKPIDEKPVDPVDGGGKAK